MARRPSASSPPPDGSCGVRLIRVQAGAACIGQIGPSVPTPPSVVTRPVGIGDAWTKALREGRGG